MLGSSGDDQARPRSIKPERREHKANPHSSIRFIEILLQKPTLCGFQSMQNWSLQSESFPGE
jgi:hypothetical protein